MVRLTDATADAIIEDLQNVYMTPEAHKECRDIINKYRYLDPIMSYMNDNNITNITKSEFIRNMNKKGFE